MQSVTALSELRQQQASAAELNALSL